MRLILICGKQWNILYLLIYSSTQEYFINLFPSYLRLNLSRAEYHVTSIMERTFTFCYTLWSLRKVVWDISLIHNVAFVQSLLVWSMQFYFVVTLLFPVSQLILPPELHCSHPYVQYIRSFKLFYFVVISLFTLFPTSPCIARVESHFPAHTYSTFTPLSSFISLSSPCFRFYTVSCFSVYASIVESHCTTHTCSASRLW